MSRFIIILLILSAFTHFLFFGYPAETVFDEVHFGKFISGYFTGEYFFDIHPPLGKLLIAGMGYLSSFKPGFEFEKISQSYPDNSYLWLRLLPLIAGVLLPLIIFLLARELNFSNFTAFAAGLFIVLENSLLAQSRFILLDIPLLFFGFLGLYLYFLSERKNSQAIAVFSAIFLAFAAGIKWTGLTFLALVLISEAIKIIRFKKFKEILPKIAVFIALPALIYFLTFAIHFSLLPKSGPGDAFMSVSFQKTLIDGKFHEDSNITPLNTFQKFTELNAQMFKANQRLTSTHPYSSKWHSWPFTARSVFYWQNDVARIYLLGNPFIYWLSFAAIIFLIISLFSKFRFSDFRSYFLAGGFLLNFLPFIFIGRVMFLYHYFAALIFAILALALVLEKIETAKIKKTAFAVLVAMFTASFIYFAPLTYGLPLSEKEYSNRAWFSSWR